MIKKINNRIAGYGCKLIVKKSIPIMFNDKDVITLIFSQKAALQFCNANNKTPKITLRTIINKYIFFRYGETVVNE